MLLLQGRLYDSQEQATKSFCATLFSAAAFACSCYGLIVNDVLQIHIATEVGATILKCGYAAIEDGSLKIPYAQIPSEKGIQTTQAGNWFYYCAILGQIFSLILIFLIYLKNNYETSIWSGALDLISISTTICFTLSWLMWYEMEQCVRFDQAELGTSFSVEIAASLSSLLSSLFIFTSHYTDTQNDNIYDFYGNDFAVLTPLTSQKDSNDFSTNSQHQQQPIFINGESNFHHNNSAEGEKQPLLPNQKYYGSIYNKVITGIVQFKEIDSRGIADGLTINDQYKNQSYFCINAPKQTYYQENKKDMSSVEGFQGNSI